MLCSLFSGAVLIIPLRNKAPFVYKEIKSPDTTLQAIELNPSCLGKTIPTSLLLVMEMKGQSFNCTLTLLNVPSIIRLLDSADA